MRPVVLMAAVGAAAVLGGVVGAGAMRFVGKQPASREDLESLDSFTNARFADLTEHAKQAFEARAWVRDLEFRLRVASVLDDAKEPFDRWWCSEKAGICYRDKGECAETSLRNLKGEFGACAPRRIAFCPEGAVHLLTCFPTLGRCLESARQFRDYDWRCVGVE